MATIILIRGNSGSGKTTVAKKLHQILGSNKQFISFSGLY
ncbi:sigma 54-interacting transcriptional regulator [Apilactobacillus quenuiae]|nr:sigma 54-interacting transcriptional regulator [Apilactobacillus quenuiae]